MTNDFSAGLPLVLFPLFWVLFWVLICVVISHVGGWRDLAGSYRSEQPRPDTVWRFQSAQMRWFMGYNNCLTVGADASGLYLAILFFFRPGHPPLFVRWEEMTLRRRKTFFVTTCEIRFRSVPDVPFTVRPRLADRLKAQAGARWPAEGIEPK